MKSLRIYEPIALLLISVNLNGQTPTSGTFPDPVWNHVWTDSFPSLDITPNYFGPWNISDSSSHENEPAIFLDDNVLEFPQADGLTVNIKKEDILCSTCHFGEYHYTSGNLVRWSSEPDNPQFGYLEAEVRISNTYGIWPAFWLWTESKKAHFIGDGGQYYRYNILDMAGDPPNTTTVNSSVDFNTVFFTEKLIGYAAGNSGEIYKTTDGGNTWNSQIVNSGITFNSIYFLDYHIGIAVGTSGTIYRTSDAGANWINISSPTTEDLNTVYFIKAKNGIAGDETGYIGGNGGTFLKSLDFGVTWNDLTEPLLNNINATYFIDIDNGFIVNNTGEVYRTGDGGDTWSLKFNHTQSLNAIHFMNARDGILVGNNGTNLNSTDGGYTWIVQPALGNVDLMSISFIDNTGFIAGRAYAGNATVYIKDDGDPWAPITISVPVSDLNYVYFDWDYDEIDIFEMAPGNKWVDCYGNSAILSNTLGTCNSWISSEAAGGCISIVGGPVSIPDFTNWVKYAVEWSPSKTIFYVNDNVVKIRPNFGYDPITNSGGMLNQKANIIIGMNLQPYLKWNSNSAYYPGNPACWGEEIDPGIYDPCASNYDDYFVSHGPLQDNNPVYPGYIDPLNLQYTANASPLDPNAWPFVKFRKVKYFKLDNSDCSNSVVIANSFDFDTFTNTVKKDVTIQGSVNSTTTKVIRAAEFVHISGDFDFNGDLYIDVNPCY